MSGHWILSGTGSKLAPRLFWAEKKVVTSDLSMRHSSTLIRYGARHIFQNVGKVHSSQRRPFVPTHCLLTVASPRTCWVIVIASKLMVHIRYVFLFCNKSRFVPISIQTVGHYCQIVNWVRMCALVQMKTMNQKRPFPLSFNC